MTSAGPRAAIRALAASLDDPTPEDALATVRACAAKDERLLRRAVTVQGLAIHLHRLARAETHPFPASFANWLAEQDRRIGRRLERLHSDLEGVLAAAARAGIAVMPLKGSLLTTRAAGPAIRRPMADLDLLVEPADRDAARAMLEDLGYRREPERNRRPTHDVFVDRGGGRIVSRDGEHPDNPRRVELHVEVRRHLWGWSDDDDLTDRLWASGRRATVLGQPAVVPSDEALLAHVAVHAASDLLAGRGRLVQWLDVAGLVRGMPQPATWPHPRVAWVSLALTRRAMPNAMAGADLSRLRRSVPDPLVGWTARVPLDDRCGLSLGRSPDAAASMAARWDRWGPARWKLAVAYGDIPLPVALARHGATLAKVGARAAAERANQRAARRVASRS